MLLCWSGIESTARRVLFSRILQVHISRGIWQYQTENEATPSQGRQIHQESNYKYKQDVLKGTRQSADQPRLRRANYGMILFFQLGLISNGSYVVRFGHTSKQI